MIPAFIPAFFKWLLSFATGGALDRVFSSIDKVVDNETKREEIKLNAATTYAQTMADDRANARSYWVFWVGWSIFTFPLGIWWALVVFDTAFTFVNWGIPDLPASIQPKADVIFGSIFGSGGLVAVAQGVTGTIRGRKK